MRNIEHQNIVQRDKYKRIKQILHKVLLPFYGNLRPKQMIAQYKKTHNSALMDVNRSDKLINNFETRLDIIVYRLNLAPSIVWARRIIRAGLIFVHYHS